MISRIQTLFLLIAIAATALSFVFPVMVVSMEGETLYKYTNYGQYMVAPTGSVKAGEGYSYIVAAAALLLLLFALSQFNKRVLQVRVCRLAYLVILAQFAMYFFIPLPEKIPAGVKVSYGVAFFMPLVALVFTFLAERAIKKDEALIRSADRLR